MWRKNVVFPLVFLIILFPSESESCLFSGKEEKAGIIPPGINNNNYENVTLKLTGEKQKEEKGSWWRFWEKRESPGPGKNEEEKNLPPEEEKVGSGWWKFWGGDEIPSRVEISRDNPPQLDLIDLLTPHNWLGGGGGEEKVEKEEKVGEVKVKERRTGLSKLKGLLGWSSAEEKKGDESESAESAACDDEGEGEEGWLAWTGRKAVSISHWFFGQEEEEERRKRFKVNDVVPSKILKDLCQGNEGKKKRKAREPSVVDEYERIKRIFQ